MPDAAFSHLAEAWYGGYVGDGTQLSQVHFTKAELPP